MACSCAEHASQPRILGPFDRIVVCTGQRPDLSLTRELRLDLDPWLESARALGPMIDPNLHSCGSVPPHGYRELSHPEPDYFAVGVKSYGRAPTFLMATGYEQVRSVAAHLAGDEAAAKEFGSCFRKPAFAPAISRPRLQQMKDAAAGLHQLKATPVAWLTPPRRQAGKRAAAAAVKEAAPVVAQSCCGSARNG